MAGTHVWPVDIVAGAPVFTGRQGRQLAVAPFVAGATAARPLGARSGVRPGTPATTVTATSTTWTVADHAGLIDAELAAEAGPYTYSFDAVQTGSMTAADPSNPRIDLISVQISDPAESDGSSTPSAAVVYTTGVASGTPAVPATPARSMALAQINVPVSGGGNPSTTWVAPTLTAAGGIIPVSSTTELNALVSLASARYPIYASYNGLLYITTGGTPAQVVNGGLLTSSTGGALAGTTPPNGTALQTVVVNGVYASGSAGRFTVTYPYTFPHGLVSAQPSLLNGDAYGAWLNFYGRPGLGSCTLQVLSGTSPVPSITPDISLMLVGW